MTEETFTLLFIILWFVPFWFVIYDVEKRGGNFLLWFLFAFFTGPIALIIWLCVRPQIAVVEEIDNENLVKFIDSDGRIVEGPREIIDEIKDISFALSTNFSFFTPFQFEKFIAELMRKMGYTTKVTPQIKDYGIDVFAEKNGNTVAIQVKKYSEGHNVGSKEVQQLLGAMWKTKANRGIFVTTSNFTRQAREQAKGTPIELWNKEILHQKVNRYYIEIPNKLYTIMTSFEKLAEKMDREILSSYFPSFKIIDNHYHIRINGKEDRKKFKNFIENRVKKFTDKVEENLKMLKDFRYEDFNISSLEPIFIYIKGLLNIFLISIFTDFLRTLKELMEKYYNEEKPSLREKKEIRRIVKKIEEIQKEEELTSRIEIEQSLKRYLGTYTSIKNKVGELNEIGKIRGDIVDLVYMLENMFRINDTILEIENCRKDVDECYVEILKNIH